VRAEVCSDERKAGISGRAAATDTSRGVGRSLLAAGREWQPTRDSGAYGEAIALARQAAPEAVCRLIQLMRGDDERVAAVAANSILDRAFGRVRPAEDPPSEREQLEAMTPEQRRAEMQALVDKARGVLAEGGPVIEGEAAEEAEEE
jgi:hypothetical protein